MSEDTRFMLTLLAVAVGSVALVALGFVAMWLEDTRERRMLARQRKARKALGRAAMRR